MSTRACIADADESLATDRRGFLFGLGVTAAAAFAPFVTARAGAAAPAFAAPSVAAPMPAVFWNLPYTDFTGLAVPQESPRRYAAERRARDFDPHAELFAVG